MSTKRELTAKIKKLTKSKGKSIDFPNYTLITELGTVEGLTIAPNNEVKVKISEHSESGEETPQREMWLDDFPKEEIEDIHEHIKKTNP